MGELSGSPQVNPKAGRTAIKDRAKFHKVISVKPVRAIIEESMSDTSKPKPTDMGNHVSGMRRLI